VQSFPAQDAVIPFEDASPSLDAQESCN
jgi:hypothetical protein